ncbi:MAG: WcaF family extracellular polysaccharide biosynthesis acetyltransferase [Verrucomicrobiota bacterium]
MDQEKASGLLDLSEYTVGEFDPGPIWKRILWLLISGVFFETFFPWPSAFKSSLLRLFGADIGEGVVIKPRVQIKYPWMLSVGRHCWLGERAWIDNLASVHLGDSVVISQRAYLLTGNHNYKSPRFDLMVSPINLQSGAWVGANATVSPGVTMAELSILSVGSVLNQDTEAGGIYQGNPAVLIRQRDFGVI